MRYVLDLEHLIHDDLPRVGAKASNLAELMSIAGVRVPEGFCITTDTFEHALAEAPVIRDELDALARLDPDDRRAIQAQSAQVRRAVTGVAIPQAARSAIAESLARFGDAGAFAVRSSGVAEDLPGASFAGQHDSYLDVTGIDAIMEHVRRCWASLFTERAVSYRRHNGFDVRDARIAVIVQQMVVATAAGVMFTADPVTSNRKITMVEAVWGLGDALASGLVDADVFAVDENGVVQVRAVAEQQAVRSSQRGGVAGAAIEATRRMRAALTSTQVVRLAGLGRRVEAHFDSPQDIEWCLAGEDFQLVQSRPITTLFPVPHSDDQDNHVYVSVGHQQMMTDAMRPLGLSFWQLTTPRPMYEAGGRLFVDVAPDLAVPAGRERMLALGKSDPLIGDALQVLLDRPGFIGPPPEIAPTAPVVGSAPAPIDTDPRIVTELIEQIHASVAELRHKIETLSGPALIDFILADIGELKRILFDPRSHQVVMAGMEAKWWLDEHLEAWLDEKDATDTLTRSVPNNVTAEMGLALLDVADVIRPYAEVVAFLDGVADDPDRQDFVDELAELPGGLQARDALRGFLDDYGMRCAGEIDITRTRWSERPAILLPAILGNVRNFAPGAAQRRVDDGGHAAREKEHELLARLRALSGGDQKADETKEAIDRLRMFAGYREYPKYGMVSRYFVYKQALLGEAARLVRSGVLKNRDDIFYLRLPELHDVVRDGRVDGDLLERRRSEFLAYRSMKAPRVFTSDGEVITGAYRRDDAPADALVGLPVSAGCVEGRARVVASIDAADLEPGDILVTAYTDPSWTPLFLTAAGLVTEVGGQMTHGAVIAREYGLPGVVGVQRATELIRDGQRIRIDGSKGYVMPLD